ncbi:PREDICTED: intraflagellar transport protein 22 homolog isoform X2 [Nanorana parkeri]|uniref:intraflagellar transport protein 22 homolog isoform X2 n=1 Tax=Nanorana parkeri TaxID=125878 RepID=UPI0008548086|nr:PREDICTED: intraflagellar transport protein 22 homolog isoform X2 [Nanorana parkeri]
MLKTKVLLVGPSECGKSVLANFLADATENIGGEYSPTQGVRFESCWPAIMKDSHGAILVFNADIPSHLKEIEMWHSNFIQQQKLQDNQCLLIAHHKPGSGDGAEKPDLSPALGKLALVHSNLEEDPEDVRMEFVKYLRGVASSLSESRDREEMSFIT